MGLRVPATILLVASVLTTLITPLSVLSAETLSPEKIVSVVLTANRDARWVQVAPGMLYRETKVASPHLTLHSWQVDPSLFRIEAVEQSAPTGSTAREFRTTYKAVLALNGGFFGKTLAGELVPSGLLIVDGEIKKSHDDDAGSGVFFVSDAGVGITWSSPQARQDTWRHAIQVGPLIVDPGGRNGIRTNNHKRVDRTAICKTDAALTFIVLDGGLSLFELGEVLSSAISAGGFACERALNLDGGPSTQASFVLGGVEREIIGDWPVQNAIVMTPRTP